MATITSLPTSLQPRLLQRWTAAQHATDALLALIRPEAIYDRPISERHRLVFYLGHLEAFDWNLLAPPLCLTSFHPEWDKLFAFGIDPVEGELPSDQPGDWPEVGAIAAYNRQVRAALAAALDDHAGPCFSGTRGAAALGPAPTKIETLLDVAIEHRLMHLETLAYLMHQLPYDRKQPGPPQPDLRMDPVANIFLPVPAGVAHLGRNRESGFGWDNEFPAYPVEVPAFSITRFKVTNAEFQTFVSMGGYQQEALWTPQDWAWKQSIALEHPHFWRRSGGNEGDWYFHGMFAERPLADDEPVWVTQAEASAYARWRGKALPTEAQWHRAAYGAPAASDGRDATPEPPFPWGGAAEPSAYGNCDLRRWDPQPVQAMPQSASAWRVEDLIGNGWEWTSTPFAPFPGFAAAPYYPGYSANFFDGKHFVLKGASPRTAACMTRRGFRNWFQPHYPYLYAGFRCVANV